jgi:hypothetical protein
VLLATEPTGTYLAVVNATGLNPGESSVESFQIDSAGERLAPVAGSFLELVSSPVGAPANSTLGIFFVYLGPNPSSSNPSYQQDGDLLTYTIDPLTGLLGSETGAAAEFSESDNCGAPTVLVPTNSCFISIVFTPATAGSRQAQLTVMDNALGSPQSVPLMGTGSRHRRPFPQLHLLPAR